MNKDLRIYLNWRRLRHIKRYNNFPVVNPMDVAQHSYYTTLLAMTLVDEWNSAAETKDIETIDAEMTLRKALVHDSDESFTSDIPWNVKHMNEKIHKSIVKAINKKVKKLYKGCGVMKDYYLTAVESKSDYSGNIVNLADMLELCLFCWEEKQMGNSSLSGLLKKGLKIMEGYPLYNELLENSKFFSDTIKMLNSPLEDYSNMLEIE